MSQISNHFNSDNKINKTRYLQYLSSIFREIILKTKSANMNILPELYSARFDFPHTTPPLCEYAIATTPRTGSTWLAMSLWKTGLLGAPIEYLNPSVIEPHTRAGDTESLSAYWGDIRSRRTSGNGVFGCKIFYNHLLNPSFPREDLAALFQPQRAIWLRRRDKSAQAVSFIRARSDQAWMGPRPALQSAIEDHQVQRAMTYLQAQEGAWARHFKRTSIPTLSLYYEDLRSDLAGCIEQVLTWFEIVDRPRVLIPLPEVTHQGQ
jgi:LPS sulfotransferase NodH